jgi:6-phosphogluconolactonase
MVHGQVTMNIKDFEHKEALQLALVDRIEAVIHAAISAHGDAHVLLSGGSTPAFIYRALSERPIQWSNVKIGLVDDRFVPSDDQYSNFRLLSDCFTQAEDVELIPMVFYTNEEEENRIAAQLAYAPFLRRIDYLLLGMGEDGHTASLFPGNRSSEQSLSNDKIELVCTEAPVHPTRRISCSKELIIQSKQLDLLIVGETKKDVLDQAISTDLPIAIVARQSAELTVFYSPQ